MEYILIIGHDVTLKDYDYKNKYCIGIDEGAFLAFQEGIPLNLAIGDFDSISISKKKQLETYTSVIQLEPKKDNTDTKEALSYCKDATKITILGGIQGKRIEHYMANLIELKNDERIELLDDHSHIFSISKSTSIPKKNYHYLSFFAIEETKDICLENFAYPLLNYHLSTTDALTISNEWTSEIGKITFKEGRLLVICSKSDH